jgi:hypothetical protein
MKTFYWDFFGPNAEPMAKHFLRHLDEFLVQNACTGCVTGTASTRADHHAVWCRPAPDFEAGIERTLRPKRTEVEPD